MNENQSSEVSTIISKILRRAVRSLDEKLDEESFATRDGNSRDEECNILTASRMAKTKHHVDWLRKVLEDTIDELSLGTHSGLGQVVKQEEALERCKRERDERERQLRLVEEEKKQWEETKLQRKIEALEEVTQHYPIREMATLEHLAFLIPHVWGNIVNEMDHLKYDDQSRRQLLMRELAEAQHVTKVTAKALPFVKKFAALEKEKKIKDIARWTERYYKETKGLKSGNAKLEEDIERLQQTYRETKEIYLKNKALLVEHKGRQAERNEIVLKI